MKTLESLHKSTPEIELKIGYAFKDRELLKLAFIHRSFINENRNVNEHNERLEFLGDSVLNLLISDYLYRYLPNTPEGDLSYLRSRLVDANSCCTYVQKLDVSSYVLLGRGESMNDGRGRTTILADLFEALIGAIYLDGGQEAAKKFLFKNFSTEIGQILKTPIRNFKADLQDFAQKKYREPPLYTVISEEGPDHSKKFIVSVSINGVVMGQGEGSSKKEAQQKAAEVAFIRIEENP